MAVFRVEKTDSYTVMCNHHLRDKSLSLKAKGLLSLILSLPDNWDYTLSGLSVINKEGVDSIRTAVNELEASGYIIRSQGRSNNGKFGNNEYIVYEKPSLDKPLSENPTTDNPITDFPTQINIDKENKELQKKDQSINPSGKTDRKDSNLKMIQGKIEYDILIKRYPKERERIEELTRLMAEVLDSNKDTIRIAGDDLPSLSVKQRFKEINQFHIEYVIECINNNKTEVRNIKQYLLTTIYNAPLTMDHYYTSLVNHHYYGKK